MRSSHRRLAAHSAIEALALCTGQSPEQKVIFEDRFADNTAQWFSMIAI